MPRLDAIGIVSANFAKSAAFYELLGFEFPEFDERGMHMEAVRRDGVRLMLDGVEMMKSMHPDWAPPTGQRMGLAFLCDSAAEVDEVHARIIAAGHASKSKPWDAFWGQRYAQVIDPDGNIVDFFAPL